MAVEIKELVIRAVATENKEKTSGDETAPELSEEQMERIISACVREILHIIERKHAK